MTDFGAQLGGLAGGVVGLVAIKTALTDIVQTGIKLEGLKNSFTAITGSVAAGRQEFTFVSATANRLGLDLVATAESYRSLSAATRNTALEGAGTRDLFIALSNASRVYGLSTEQTSRALVAMQQVISKGKVSQEELRGQLAEAIPGAAQIAARAFGVTTQAMDEMVKSGVDSIEFARRFTAQLNAEIPAATKIAGQGFAELANQLVHLKARLADSGITKVAEDIAAGIAAPLAKVTEADQRLKSQAAAAFKQNDIDAGPDDLSIMEDIKRQKAELIAMRDIGIVGRFRNPPVRIMPGTKVRVPIRFKTNADLEQEIALLDASEKALAARVKTQGQFGKLAAGDVEEEMTARFGTEQMPGLLKEAEGRRVKGRFAEIDVRTDLEIDAQKELARETKKRLEEVAQLEQQAAEGRVKLFTDVQVQQNQFLEGLQTEIDRVMLSEDAYRRKTAAELGFGEESEERKKKLDDLLFERDVVETIVEARKTVLDIEREVAAIREHTIRIEDKILKDEARLRGRAARDTLRDEERLQRDVTDLVTNSILDMTDIGKRSFSEMIDSWIQNLQRFAIQKFVAPQIEKWVDLGLKALGIGASALGGRPAANIQPVAGASMTSAPTEMAGGGTMMPNRFYEVGEHGSETIWSGSTGGTVYPHGTTPGVTVNGPLMVVYANDAGSFQRGSGEIESKLLRAVQRAQRNV